MAPASQAKLAEEAARYDEMVEAVAALAKLRALDPVQRNLLAVAYKNTLGRRQSSWRVVASIEAREKEKGASSKTVCLENYRLRIEEEMRTICRAVLDLISGHILPKAETAEAKVFAMKMAGDYCRYLSEFSTGAKRAQMAARANEEYLKATEAAEHRGGLAPTHPVRLGLALNYAVFLFEIQIDAEKACAVAKSAFDQAIGDLASVSAADYTNSTLIMQLLRDNITLWTSSAATGDD